MKNKFVALLVSCTLILSLAAPALGETTMHERVYVVSSPDGTVQSLVDNIRLENADHLDELRDRTLLTDIENLSGSESFTLNGESLIWQAAGNDIIYQGTSDKAPALLPVVSISLNGEEMSAEALKEKTGEVTLTVRYQTADALPLLAVTIIPLPEESVSSLVTENAIVFNEMGMQALVGWAVPGMDEKLNLPDSFSATFHAEHADLSWMMTIATADPIEAVCKELDEIINLDLHAGLNSVSTLLTALKNGEALPDTHDMTKIIGDKINQLNDGLDSLDSGASDLADGASALSEGAAALRDGLAQAKPGAVSLSEGLNQLASGADELNSGAVQLSDGAKALADGLAQAGEGASTLTEGLQTLTANNEALNAGAAAVFSAVLDTANAQLSTALAESGIEFQAMTQENYAEVLDAILSQVNPEAAQASAYSKVREAVEAKVGAASILISTAVEASARKSVIEAVLKAASLEMTMEEYVIAVNSGRISEETAAEINATVDVQMASEEVQAQIKESIQEKLDQMVEEYTQNYLATDETVAAKLADAQNAYESLTALKEQLDQLSAFVTGLSQYTDGVTQASEGAGSLSEGLSQLSSGATTLNTGASALSTGTASLSEGAAQAKEGATSLAEGLTSLADGSVSLADGAETLADGAKKLQNDGTGKLAETIREAEKNVAKVLLPYVENEAVEALRIFDETRVNTQECGYDLRPEGMKSVTLYIIRTDMQ